MTNLVVAATDGSAINNPNGPAGWAWYVSGDCWGAGGFPKASNQVAELFAVLALLRAVPRDRPLLIRTDSQYTIGVTTKWMTGWKRKGWMKADGKPVQNLTLIKELDLALTGRDVRFEWVRGHSGDQMNESADRLCGAASKAMSTRTPVVAGPGWTGAPLAALEGEVLPRAPRAVAPRTAPPAGSRGLSPEARARMARTKPASIGHARPRLPEPVGRRLPEPHRAPRRDVAQVESRPKQNTSPIGSCPSCNTPMHPVTFECKCSW